MDNNPVVIDFEGAELLQPGNIQSSKDALWDITANLTKKEDGSLKGGFIFTGRGMEKINVDTDSCALLITKVGIVIVNMPGNSGTFCKRKGITTGRFTYPQLAEALLKYGFPEESGLHLQLIRTIDWQDRPSWLISINETVEGARPDQSTNPANTDTPTEAINPEPEVVNVEVQGATETATEEGVPEEENEDF